ncbi:MAG: hypothetical protein AB8B79_16180 [Granulosicoccus sp.]
MSKQTTQRACLVLSSNLRDTSLRCRHRGFALFTTVILVLIAGILLSSAVHTTRETERTAGNAIQYSRAMEAAEGGAVVAFNSLVDNNQQRSFADESASEGIFSLESVDQKWWENPNYSGQHTVDSDVLLGVVNPPRYVYEEIGVYIADGDTGIVNMDIGGAAYGKTSAGAREHVLYKVESQGVGSTAEVVRAVETVIVLAR